MLRSRGRDGKLINRNSESIDTVPTIEQEYYMKFPPSGEENSLKQRLTQYTFDIKQNAPDSCSVVVVDK